MTARKLIRRIRPLATNESGMTMVEMSVAMMLMVIVAVVYLNTLTSVYTGANRQQKRSQINDEARNAVQQIDRAVRSGDILYDPTESVSSPGCGGYACVPNFSLRVYTQYNGSLAGSASAPATMDASGHQCVQYLINNRTLLRRTWTPVTRASVSGWRTIATDIVNQDVSPQVPAFARETGNRILDVTFVLNNRLGQADAPRTVRVETSIAIRNYGSGDPCTPIP
jgi:prepilin-type N-terminal cleavage/methylation domain-containing protein